MGSWPLALDGGRRSGPSSLGLSLSHGERRCWLGGRRAMRSRPRRGKYATLAFGIYLVSECLGPASRTHTFIHPRKDYNGGLFKGARKLRRVCYTYNYCCRSRLSILVVGLPEASA